MLMLIEYEYLPAQTEQTASTVSYVIFVFVLYIVYFIAELVPIFYIKSRAPFRGSNIFKL